MEMIDESLYRSFFQISFLRIKHEILMFICEVNKTIITKHTLIFLQKFFISF